MNEADTRAEPIEPALRAAGWGAVEDSLIRREVIAPGRLQGGGGRRSKAPACDFVLTDRGGKPAAIEAIPDELKANSTGLVCAARRKLDPLAGLKQSILHKAFAGELTAGEPEPVLAEAGA